MYGLAEGLYLLNGKRIECEWRKVDGQELEVFSHNLNDQELIGLCQSVSDQLQFVGSEGDRMARAYQMISQREFWNAAPDKHPEYTVERN